jgi:glyoxylase-like metal-dependent hydrolase (beta-lactamase superfamily II)
MRIKMSLVASALAASIVLSGALVPSTSALASSEVAGIAAQWRSQVPGVYRYRLGNFQITALSDGTVPQDLHALLTNTNPAGVDALLNRSFLSNPVEASINAFLIDTGSKLVLVDTGSGLLFGPGNGGKLLGSLKAAGYAPEDVNDILITHIHTDHSGGLTSNGHLVFPNATVHVGKPDVDFFLNPANIRGVDGYDRKYFEEASATVGPYVKAGRVRAISGETQILPGITAIPTPGHTPGHSFFRVESQGESIEFIGDIVHVASVQFPQTSVTIVYDVDPKRAAAERARQFARAAAQRVLVAGAHLPYPGIGHIRAETDGGYTFVPVDYRDRDAH